MATGMSRRGCVERYTTPMAPRPSSASIGYRPSWVVLNFLPRGSQYARQYGANSPITTAAEPRSGLVEDGERQVERHAEVGLVDDLADAQVPGQAAQDVGVLPAQRVVGLEPGDRVPHGVAGVLHEVRPERANRVVAGGVAPRLQRLGRGEEVVAPP